MTPIAVVLAASLTTSVQAHPDFSGRWRLDSPSPAPEPARVLVIEQPVTRTTVRGEPTAPTYLYLTVHREGSFGTTTDRYILGTRGGVVGGIDRSGKQIGLSAYFETAWRGDTLAFLSDREGPDGPHTGDWSEQTESWSLEADGRLRVEVETEAHDRARQTTVLRYHRE